MSVRAEVLTAERRIMVLTDLSDWLYDPHARHPYQFKRLNSATDGMWVRVGGWEGGNERGRDVLRE